MSLACCWQEAGGFPESIQKVFRDSDVGLFNKIDVLLAIPEYQVSLPGGARSSQNDIFVLAKGDDQLISIMVEGKVSEPFGDLVSEWYKDPSPGKQKRLKYLCSVIGLEEAQVLNIRYQLLPRTAAAIIEANKFNAHSAMMLVHSFSQKNEGFNDYSAFTSLLGVEAKNSRIYLTGNKGGVDLFLCWVSDYKHYGSISGRKFVS
jgi:hypothetical protein